MKKLAVIFYFLVLLKPLGAQVGFLNIGTGIGYTFYGQYRDYSGSAMTMPLPIRAGFGGEIFQVYFEANFNMVTPKYEFIPENTTDVRFHEKYTGNYFGGGMRLFFGSWEEKEAGITFRLGAGSEKITSNLFLPNTETEVEVHDLERGFAFDLAVGYLIPLGQADVIFDYQYRARIPNSKAPWMASTQLTVTFSLLLTGED